MSALIGRRLGVYEVRDFIGAGGMGEVYRAHDVRLQRDVAIKVLPASVTSDPSRVARFEREAQILASLNHPHIAAVYGLEDCDGTQALILELVEGETLQDRLRRGPLPLAEAWRMAREVAAALGSAHLAGIVHRDIKPANILLSPSGGAKIIDFGVASLLQSERHALAKTTVALTSPGAVVGTARYMSPEQMVGLAADPRSDVFSFGLVLYEAITGEHAFAANDGTFPTADGSVANRLLVNVPKSLRDILSKALSIDAASRYATAREMSEALRTSDSLPRDGWPVRRSLAGAAAAIALAAIAAFLLGRPSIEVGPLSSLPRVAVFPFENLSKDPADNWLGEAFADSLTIGLRSLDTVLLLDRDRVIESLKTAGVSEGGAIDFTALDLPAQLGIQQYVHGTVQRVAHTIRVSARMVDNHGAVKLQATVTGDVAELFRLQDDLADRFGAAIDAGATIDAARTHDVGAYQAALDGKRLYALGQYAESANRFQAAVRFDPAHAEAWALLAKADARLAAPASSTTNSPAEYQQRAMVAAERAIALAPALYEAQVAVALASRESGRLDAWRSAAQRAIEINPRVAEAHALLADSYSAIPTWGCARDRDPVRAELHYRRALDLDPRWYAAYTSLITELQWTDRLDEALRVSDEALRAVPGNRPIRTYRGILLNLLARQDEGELDLIAAIPENSPSVLDQLFLGGLDLQRGQPQMASRRFDAILRSRKSPLTLLLIAYAYVVSSHAAEAAPLISQAIDLDPACAAFVQHSPIGVRGKADPAIAAVLAKHDAAK